MSEEKIESAIARRSKEEHVRLVSVVRSSTKSLQLYGIYSGTGVWDVYAAGRCATQEACLWFVIAL